MILSIQSHVAYGYVGNRAAVFPLQRLGLEVVQINSVQFSNHTGYGTWTGDIFSADHISRLIDGLRDRGALAQTNAVLSGYLGSSELGEIVLKAVAEIRELNPQALYCCDPVMGDVGRGLFVKPDLPPFFMAEATPRADIITPNQFELTALTGREIVTLQDAISACESLIERGTGAVLVTSLLHAGTPPDSIQMLVVTSEGEKYLVTTPLLPFAVPPNGSGDATSALFLGHYLRSGSYKIALEQTATAIFGIFEATRTLDRRELALVQAQNHFSSAAPRFTADAL